ncbi:MAG: ribonuclease R [Desulfobulbaceae bacterium]|nr:ribonuclease R [Desulfobulbaceae bacterium]
MSSRTLVVDNLLAYLAARNEPVGMGQILQALNLPGNERKPIKAILEDLEKKGRVERSKQKYLLTGDSGLLQATIDMKAGGFGFALVQGAGAGQKDPYLSRTHLNGASHGDTVLIRLLGSVRGRPEARVVTILKRGITRLCGIYMSGGRTGYVTPDNSRLPFTVLVRRSNNLGARDNMAVLVEILDYGLDGRSPEGRILEILGDPLTAPVQIRMAIEQFELTVDFPRNVLLETRALEPLTAIEPGRVDLRHIEHVTIDGDTAKDFDDAIAVEKKGKGYTLYVSIADVSHYVKTGSAIDIEAFRRGTSVYFPDRVIPMLPERLSNDLCSLVPDEDRPAFTAILDFNGRGKRIGSKFCKSMIRSRQRFTYTTVRRILYDKPAVEQEKYRSLMPMLEGAKKLAVLLHKTRMARGSIGFNIPEADVHLKGDKIDSIQRAERNQAHQLIEEFMLAANEAVAETMDREKRGVLYRIHERPDPEKVKQFTEATTSMGLQLPPSDITPDWFARVIEKAENTPAEYVINNLMLRTMQQARYSPENAGHFGLAADYYLHFTSPIRRYPDLVAHRVLQNFLNRDKDFGNRQILPEKTPLEEAGVHLSKRERISVDVERNTQSRLGALYLLDHIGDEFEGIISGVTSFGLFIELLETFISGAIAIGDLRDDYYIYDERAHKLTGETTGRTFQMGNLLRVKLDHVDMITKKITFVPAQ